MLLILCYFLIASYFMAPFLFLNCAIKLKMKNINVGFASIRHGFRKMRLLATPQGKVRHF